MRTSSLGAPIRPLRLSILPFIIRVNNASECGAMPSTYTMANLVRISAATRFDIQNWLNRVELRSVVPPTGQGRAREFTEENVVEITCIAAFVAMGISPSSAAAYGAVLLRHWRRSRQPVRRWLVFAAGKPDTMKGTDHLSEEALEGLDRQGTPIVCAVDAAALFERIERQLVDVGR